ncbi:hypothetical protein PACTADRAFT_3765 [Pachysolen tannophilus NRRL Y-2460]|uniref:Cell division control protein 73 C-terminal domain-containing protein n=1 Tax=Pachysolen tannophilus NRRL Y-2460 TaxID=669874 RepID=A0A1E4TT12_PACTA|nr:hypothetical protein PACTADRAFT_3765 [Pachysolen tannophilus NRRL Y-2460]
MPGPDNAAIAELQSAIQKKTPIKMLDNANNEVDDISVATSLLINDKNFNLDVITNYQNQSLKAVYFSWLNRDSSSTEYIKLANDKDIPTLSFIQRTELISILLNASTITSTTKTSIAGADSTTDSASKVSETGTKKRKLDKFTEDILSNEREIPSQYRGTDYNNLIKIAQNKIIYPLTKGKKPSASNAVDGTKSHPVNLYSSSLSTITQDTSKDPIIILSPASSSIINLGNVVRFLKDGVFEPPTVSTVNNGIVKLKKQTRFGPMSFLIIENTDKFFNKPDYWRRVVAIFTTGQKWQFKSYPQSNPNKLFRQYPGFFVNYGDKVPKQIEEWGNINVISIDKNRRFKDLQIVESFWDTLEKSMANKGYGSTRR